MASEHELGFNFVFALFAYVLVYPPKEFIACGLTADRAYAALNALPEASVDFVQHHARRTALNCAVHAALPALYAALSAYNSTDYGDRSSSSLLWTAFATAAFAGALGMAALTAVRWRTQRWALIDELRKFRTDASQDDWQAVATSINDEFRRPEKLLASVSTICTVLATENWIVKLTPYRVHVAHQSDATLSVVASDTHAMDQDTSDTVQYVNIVVRSARRGIAPFDIRLNALDFAELQDRVNRPIAVMGGVNFSRSLMDRFVDTFKELVAQNPRFTTDQELDTCFACMQAVPNVKLQQCCSNTDGNGNPMPADRHCSSCFCRPMWCVDCLAKWFASRQNADERDTWLEQKCSCPMCRARFCLLDVCLVNDVDGGQ